MTRPQDVAGLERAGVAVSGLAVALAVLGVGEAATTYGSSGGWLAVSACTAAAVGAILAALQGRWSPWGIAAVWLATCVAPWAAATYRGPIHWDWYFAMTGRTTWCQAVGAGLVGTALLLARRASSTATSRWIALVGLALLICDVVVVSRDAARVPLPGLDAMELLALAVQGGATAGDWLGGWTVAGPIGPGFDPDGIASLGAAVAFFVGLVVAGLVVFTGRRRWAGVAWTALLLALVWPVVVPVLWGAVRGGQGWGMAWTSLAAVCSGAVSLVLLASSTSAAVVHLSGGRALRTQPL